MDLLMSVTDGLIQWPLPHWRIYKVSLQLPGPKRLRDLIICESSLKFRGSLLIGSEIMGRLNELT